MFKINDYIIYGNVGVCKVLDITRESIMKGEEKEYYVLNPIYSKHSKTTVIKIPTDNDKIFMREIISKDEVDSLIKNIPNQEVIWVDNDRERSEEFKAMIKSADCHDLITVIKSIQLHKEKKKSVNKKACKSDEEILKLAEKMLHQEFAAVLGIKPEEVKKYIKTHTEN